MSSTESQPGARRRQDFGVEPEDAHRGFVASQATEREEAVAEREMADAERAVVAGAASEDTVTRVRALDGLRTHEERRGAWIDGA